MNKKIIAIAVAGAFALPMAAQADMKVYGMAQVEVGSWGGDDAAGISAEDKARGRIGFKASEDLGGGLKGIAKFEFITDTADGTVAGITSLGPREALVGLKGSWGQFEAGRLKSAYKYYGGVKYDQYTASLMESRRNGGMTGGTFGHNSFLADSIAYQGKFGLVSLRVTYDLDDGGESGNGGTVAAADASGNVLSAGVKVGKKNWDAVIAYVNNDADGTEILGVPQASYSSAKIGGSFTFAGAHTIRGQYEAYSTDDSSDASDGTVAYVNYVFKFGKNNLDVAYGLTDVKADASDDSTFARVALKHKFSKQTSTWVGYRMFDTDATGGDYSVISLGLRKDF